MTLPGALSVGAGRQNRGLRLLHFGGGDGLHRAGHLGQVLDAANASADFSQGFHRDLAVNGQSLTGMQWLQALLPGRFRPCQCK
jgi:hypothetical protein